MDASIARGVGPEYILDIGGAGLAGSGIGAAKARGVGPEYILDIGGTGLAGSDTGAAAMTRGVDPENELTTD